MKAACDFIYLYSYCLCLILPIETDVFPLITHAQSCSCHFLPDYFFSWIFFYRWISSIIKRGTNWILVAFSPQEKLRMFKCCPKYKVEIFQFYVRWVTVKEALKSGIRQSPPIAFPGVFGSEPNIPGGLSWWFADTSMLLFCVYCWSYLAVHARAALQFSFFRSWDPGPGSTTVQMFQKGMTVSFPQDPPPWGLCLEFKSSFRMTTLLCTCLFVLQLAIPLLLLFNKLPKT